MFKFVIVLTALVYYANAVGVVPLEVDSLSDIIPRREPSTATYYRLPTTTVPIRYDVTLTTDIDQGIYDFTGNVIIYLKVEADTDRIVIHHRQLTIGEINLIEVEEVIAGQYQETGSDLSLLDTTYNSTTEFLTIPLNAVTLTRGKLYKLEIHYDGILRGTKAGVGQTNTGFFRSSYTNAAGVETWLAATKFEPHDARHAFPCYDEPALKAKFNIVLRHGPTYTAISNMPAIESVIDGDHQKTTFAVSPVMSTYLVAFVISDFDYVSNQDEAEEGEVIHRVFGTPARKDQLSFTLEAGVKILDALDTYIGINYYDTIPKMDQIGLPDFSSGAMENWGLVTYTESYFYYSSASAYNQKSRIANVVAHEFAHQWFGNLVSPQWWNFIWLNEGFATLFEYLIPNIVYPEYEALDYFTIQVCQRVLITDSASDIRPMTFDAYSPTEVSALFDRIAYDKSGCVINMIMHALGENNFKAGLKTYLTAQNQSDGTSDYLFEALQSHASTIVPPGLTVKSVFEKWTTQRGYPILTVTFNTTTKAITLQQEAFLIDSLSDVDELTWTIPYNFITNLELNPTAIEDTTIQDWLISASEILTPTAARNWTAANWVLFNKKLTGYYRVNYNTENWNAIITYMANSDNAMKIHYLNRAQVLGDAMNIARANRLSYDIPLRLAQNMMKHETNYFTVTPFINDFNYLEQICFDTTNYQKLLKLAVDVLPTAYNYYTATESVTDLYNDVIARYNLVNFMCRVGFSKCHEDTTAALIRYLDGSLTVSAYLKPVILQNGLRNANSTIFLQIWRSIMTSTSQADRSTFIAGLGLTNSADNIQHLFGSVLTESSTLFDGVTINYSLQERTTILTTIASSKVSGFRRVLQLLKTESVTVKEIFGNNIVTVFNTLAGRTSTAETLAQLKELMTIYQANDVDSRFVGYTATAQSNVVWNAEAGATINSALNAIYPDEPEVPGATNYILPHDTVPILYDVTITTDIDKGIFDFIGNVGIYIKAVSAADRIVIHHRQLTIGSISLIEVSETAGQYNEVGFSWPLKDFKYNVTNEFLTIPLSDVTLVIGRNYKLDINYTGVLRGTKAGSNQQDAGFYRSSYINANDELTWLATTQFAATDARHAFPCYDEPALKAKFNIVLIHGSTYTAISNMPALGTVPDGSRVKTTFAVTPIMSTYLIAFVVSDFDYVSNLVAPVAGKVMHRVFGTPARKDQLNFTLEAGVKMLDQLDTYLDVKYYDTMPKMDQIAIPDFAFGAMENWGLVTYTESAFYYSPASPHNQKDRIAKIVAHEFAHQWFGNLVSPKWWNYVWLNEGFATVFEYLIPNMVYPEYQALDYFTIQVCQRVFITDSVSDIRPMTFDAFSPSEIMALFDRIAYDKSGCVISMIMHALGENNFKAGLKTYLSARNQSDGTSDDLFSALQTHASTIVPPGMTVKSVFEKWTTQRGYPMLTVTFNTTTNTITLQQEAFLIDSLIDDDQLTWTIPYNFITNLELSTAANANTSRQGWLISASETLTPTAARNWTNANWVLFNKKLTGYYRVNYNTDNWNAIITYMANSDDAMEIHYLNRAQLLGDAMNIARANRLSYDIPIRLARNMMRHEIDYFTWTPFINDFIFLEQTLLESTSYSQLLQWAIDVGTPAYNYYTVTENDTELYYDTMTRYNLVNFMCKVGYNKCLQDTNTALVSYLENTLTVSSFLKPAILQNGLRNANSELFLQVWNLIMENPEHVDRATFISGLGLTISEQNIQHLLDSILTENDETYSNVKINYSSAERNTILATIAANNLNGFKRILDLLNTQSLLVKQIFGNSVVTIFSTLASRTSTSETLAQLKQLMTSYQANDVNYRFPGYTTTAEQNVEWNVGAGATINVPLDLIYPAQPESSAASTMVVSSILITLTLILKFFM